ncbi:shikimate dehydrogenase (NADP(+)) [Labrys miyagiensis]|uniref:Shikimate dehydrogenase (NADP(+)) n=1 Tax=Labrys miyagiensis TaxID=346912 RepID=A0ABQ6CEK8_9HYPH|nr:shikimate dehydrogenase [Labrys miyagiensis]GLS17245.1 shikimate dehydrogenase (NADP(+)) [Labrys miyagiensis]
MKRAFVVGYPISHSRSPLIHSFWLREAGIEGSYERLAVEPAAFPDFINTLKQQGFVGGNVTVPHKEEAFRLAFVDDPVARDLHAVNTLWLEGDTLKGANTDVVGFLANLDQEAPGWDGRLGRAVVLGAGGASRAVLYGLLQRGAGEILLANRTFERAQALATHFGPKVKPMAWEEAGAVLPGTDILVNTTSLGMKGQPPLELDLAGLPETALVTDIVYVPLETPLLAKARSLGLRTVDGLGMLLHQAVPGFERWFGVRPVVSQELRALVLADIEVK